MDSHLFPARVLWPLIVLLTSILHACGAPASRLSQDATDPVQHFADVVSVTVTGAVGAYSFSVGVASPDTGCEEYADWWEVLSEDGRQLYRRALTHSHVDEQPFVRSGGPIPVDADEKVIIRAHMSVAGYGGGVFLGSVGGGFEAIDLVDSFAPEIECQTPLLDGCAF